MDNEETSRVGKKWTVEENDNLCQELADNKTYEEIALIHKRTIIGIKSRVVTNILYPKYKHDNITIEDLSTLYNIEQEIIEKYINKMESPNKKTKKTDEKENIIEYRLMMIEQKLDYLTNIMNAIYHA
uniref:Uncharacterized protein n=1 Tax=viral metagenome TaxID=1070528 RepID=A0A6C0LGY7_9ZZZZ